MTSFLPILWFLFFAGIGFWMFILRGPKKEDLIKDVLSMGETQMGREINAVIRDLTEKEEAQGFLERLDTKLKQSQTGITTPVYLIIMAVSMMGIFFLSNLILRMPIVAFLFCFLGILIPRMLVNHLRAKNIDGFDRQLVAVLRRLSSLLRSGMGLKQALTDISMSSSVPGKVRIQFKQVLQQIEAGYELEPALFELYQRIGSESLLYVAVSVDVLRKQGADLPDVFETISQNISAKNLSERRVRSTLAQARASSNLLSALPFFIIGALSLMNHSYFQPLFQTVGGRVLLFGILFVMVLGFFVFRKMSKIS